MRCYQLHFMVTIAISVFLKRRTTLGETELTAAPLWFRKNQASGTLHLRGGAKDQFSCRSESHRYDC